MARFGCLLIAVALVALFALVVLPVLPFFENSEFFDDMLAPILCPDGKVVREQYQTTDSEGTGYSMNVYCRDSEGEEADVTGLWIGIGILGFVVPFLIGLSMLIGGINSAVRGTLPTLVTDASNFVGGTYGANPGASFGSGASSGGGTLAQRLQELENTRSQGLISEDEYRQMRQKILDENT